MSNEGENNNVPFGKGDINVYFGLANEAKSDSVSSWINSFVDKTKIGDREVHGFNQAIHSTGGTDGMEMRTYPIKSDILDRIRAIKFEFTVDEDTEDEKKFSRAIRFDSLHLRPAQFALPPEPENPN